MSLPVVVNKKGQLCCLCVDFNVNSGGQKRSGHSAEKTIFFFKSEPVLLFPSLLVAVSWN